MAQIEGNDHSQLSQKEREVVSCILEECTNALIIYQHTLNRSSNYKSPLRHTEGRTVYDETWEQRLFRLSCYVRQIIEELKEQIRREGRFDVLRREIEKITRRKEKERALFEECKAAEERMLQLQKLITATKINNEAEGKRLREKLLEMKRHNESMQMKTNVEHEYAWKREKAKREQNSIRLEKRLEGLQKLLSDFSSLEAAENRVSTELTNFLTQDIARIEENIEKWQQRYEEEWKMYEKEIRDLQSDIENRQKLLDDLLREYQQKQEFIEAYLAEKEELRKQKEHENHVHRCAIEIQAWWRGVMVRNKLGPYRVQDKKKKRTVKTKK